MDNALLDTSWTIYYQTINTPTYRSLLNSQLSNQQLESYAEQLKSSMTTTEGQYQDDVDDENEKLGSLKECRWSQMPRHTRSTTKTKTATSSRSINDAQRHNSKQSILIKLIYQKQTYQFILVSENMTLCKASTTHARRVFDFLTDTFGISLDILKLDSSFLQQILSNYIDKIVTNPSVINSDASNDDEHDHNNPNQQPNQNSNPNLNRMAILKTALSNLKIALSFSAPVAPNLKSIELDIPHETINTLLSKTLLPTSSLETNSNSANEAGEVFLTNLSYHITEQTGIKFPLSSSSSSSIPTTQTASPVRLSRITTAFWVFSVEGKIKFSSRVVGGVVVNSNDHPDGHTQNDTGYESIIRYAGSDIISALDDEAMKRGNGET